MTPLERCFRIGRAATAGLAIGVLLVAGPVALAQDGQADDPWAGSAFDPPWDAPDAVIQDPAADITGRLLYWKQHPSDTIESAEVTVTDEPSDSFEPAEACELPEPHVQPGDAPDPAENDELRFVLEDLTLACNGRYVVTVVGTVGEATHTLTTTIVADVPAGGANDLTVTSADAGHVVLGWKLPTDAPVDLVGFVVERAGPAATDAELDDFTTISGLVDDPALRYDDAPPADGQYRYRLRSVRRSTHGSLLSRLAVSPTVDATVTGVPVTTTTTTTPYQPGNSIPTVPRSAGAPMLPAAPTTTIDPGFNETIDYGASSPFFTVAGGETAELPEAPADGAMRIFDEAENADIVVPLAGALVLLGWAGHLAYLNRLARHL